MAILDVEAAALTATPAIDDPVWDFLVRARLELYIPAVRAWWANIEDFSPSDTGVTELDSEPPGLCIRFTRVAVRSPIRMVQAFPFVASARLQLSRVSGGYLKMLDRVCSNGRMVIDEFTVICKSNVATVANYGQFLAFVPTKVLRERDIGQWIYMTPKELDRLKHGKVLDSLRLKARLKA